MDNMFENPIEALDKIIETTFPKDEESPQEILDKEEKRKMLSEDIYMDEARDRAIELGDREQRKLEGF